VTQRGGCVRALLDRLAGSGQAGTGSAGHPTAVVTVPGDGVEPAQLVLPVTQQFVDRRQRLQDAGSGVPTGVGRCRDHVRGAGALGNRGRVECLRLGPSEAGGVRRGQPEVFQLVVQPGDGQRAAGHVETGDELADLRGDDRQPGPLQERADGVPQHEQLLVLDRAQAVDEHRDSLPRIGRYVGEDLLHHVCGQLVRRGKGAFADAGLAVDAKPPADRPLRQGEQRFVRPWEGAAAERGSERPGQRVGAGSHGSHPGQVVAVLSRCAGDLEDDEIAGDSAASVFLAGGGAGDVVGYGQDLHGDALGPQPRGRGGEVEHIAGVVAEAEQHSAALIDGPADVDHLPGGR
jgi:hypothetical protein